MRDHPFLPLAIWLLGLVMGGLCGAILANNAWRRDAVQHGVAEFGITPEGQAMWRWKPTPHTTEGDAK